MRIAYLINAHKDFNQLERLVARLDDDGADFFIHIDKKVGPASFSALSEALGAHRATMIPERVDVTWGCFSQVEATLGGLRAVLRSGSRPDYVSLISGQDYPIRSNAFILKFLSERRGAEFVESCELSPRGWAGAMIRFERYWLNEMLNHHEISLALRSVLSYLLPKRKVPLGYRAYGGSGWWTISYDCASYIVDFVAGHKDFVNFYRTTACPDEMFFQTIIMNSRFASQVYGDNLRYIDWSEGNPNPKVLTKDDFHLMQSSDKLFARKFDACLDGAILDLMDIARTARPPG